MSIFFFLYLTHRTFPYKSTYLFHAARSGPSITSGANNRWQLELARGKCELFLGAIFEHEIILSHIGNKLHKSGSYKSRERDSWCLRDKIYATRAFVGGCIIRKTFPHRSFPHPHLCTYNITYNTFTRPFASLTMWYVRSFMASHYRRANSTPKDRSALLMCMQTSGEICINQTMFRGN